MKKLSLLSTAALVGLLTAPLQAGTEVYKQVAPQAPVVYGYGLGFYGALDAGANVYQNSGDTRVFTGDNRINDITDRDFDATLEVDPKNDVGFFGGVKLGYVFGSGVIRPTIEGDFFYNGFRTGWDGTLNTASLKKLFAPPGNGIWPIQKVTHLSRRSLGCVATQTTV